MNRGLGREFASDLCKSEWTVDGGGRKEIFSWIDVTKFSTC